MKFWSRFSFVSDRLYLIFRRILFFSYLIHITYLVHQSHLVLISWRSIDICTKHLFCGRISSWSGRISSWVRGITHVIGGLSLASRGVDGLAHGWCHSFTCIPGSIRPHNHRDWWLLRDKNIGMELVTQVSKTCMSLKWLADA